MSIADVISWIATVPVAVANSVFTLELLCGLVPARNAWPNGDTSSVRYTVLMPAHNEAAIIGATLAKLMACLPSGASVLVVADNCSDDTAAIARASGAHVLERHDLDQRGKGFALAHGRDFLRRNPPECVVVLDADCQVEAGSLDALAKAALLWDSPVQGGNLLSPGLVTSPMVEASVFAFAVKNEIRQLGLKRLGGAALMTGTGMAFPWRVFKVAPLQSASIVEDLELGLELLLAGETPSFLPQARVWSPPSSEAGTLKQRSRWEGGFISVAVSRAVPTLFRGIRQIDKTLVWVALHLLTPPLVLLILLNLIVIGLLLVGMVFGAAPCPFRVLTGLQLAAALALVAAWIRLGKRFLSIGTAIRLPLYIAWKVPIYARLLVRRGGTGWARADREPDV